MIRTVLCVAACIIVVTGCRRAPSPAAVPVLAGPETLLPYGSTVPSGVSSVPSGIVPSGALTYETIAGRYRGQSELIRGGGRCARGGNISFNMRDAVVRFRVDRTVPELAAAVALDGFFLADNGASVIRGRFTPNRLDFDAGTLRCGYRYSLAKS